MITSVTIEGFKSFGSPAQPVALGPLNFIVGANASGKTNFVAALRFLRLSLLHGLDHTVNHEFSGCRETRNRVLHERGEQIPVGITVRLDTPGLDFTAPDGRAFTMAAATYTLRADLRSDDSSPVVLSENFAARLTAGDGTASTYTLERDLTRVRIHDPTNAAAPDRVEVVHRRSGRTSRWARVISACPCCCSGNWFPAGFSSA